MTQPHPPPKDDATAHRLAQLKSLRQLMRTEGKPIITHLFHHFPPDRPRFTAGTSYDSHAAAVADGQSQVTAHLRSLLVASDTQLLAIASQTRSLIDALNGPDTQE